MTIDELKEDISMMIDEDLMDQYELYSELASSGVNDQIRLSLLEQEVMRRGLGDSVAEMPQDDRPLYHPLRYI